MLDCEGWGWFFFLQDRDIIFQTLAWFYSLFFFFFNKTFVELQKPNVNPKFPAAKSSSLKIIGESAIHTTGIILISISRQSLFSLPVRLDCPFVL